MLTDAMNSSSQTRGAIVGHYFNRFTGDLRGSSFDRLQLSFGPTLHERNGNEMYCNALILPVRGSFGTQRAFQASYTYSQVEDFGQAGARNGGGKGAGIPSQHGIQRFKDLTDPSTTPLHPPQGLSCLRPARRSPQAEVGS